MLNLFQSRRGADDVPDQILHPPEAVQAFVNIARDRIVAAAEANQVVLNVRLHGVHRMTILLNPGTNNRPDGSRHRCRSATRSGSSCRSSLPRCHSCNSAPGHWDRSGSWAESCWHCHWHSHTARSALYSCSPLRSCSGTPSGAGRNYCTPVARRLPRFPHLPWHCCRT